MSYGFFIFARLLALLPFGAIVLYLRKIYIANVYQRLPTRWQCRADMPFHA